MTKISYPVKMRFLSFTCEDITVFVATSVSANRKRASQHNFYEIYMPHCYNVQNTYKRYLFSLSLHTALRPRYERQPKPWCPVGVLRNARNAFARKSTS